MTPFPVSSLVNCALSRVEYSTYVGPGECLSGLDDSEAIAFHESVTLSEKDAGRTLAHEALAILFRVGESW